MNKLIFFRILFSIALIGLIIFALLFTFYIYDIQQKDKISANLAKSYSMSYLYTDNPAYSTSEENVISNLGSDNPFVIGVIKIDKLKLDYPILSTATEELLNIAPCRFAGPLPNNVGNLCIAGHNYIDNTFFAKISSLELNDEILIYGIDGNLVRYYVFDKKEVLENDISCTSQETNGKRIVTLMTCNSLKHTRILIMATEK